MGCACGGEVRDGACARFSCDEARAFRVAVMDYLEAQASADLAVVAWTPMFAVGVALALQERLAMGGVAALGALVALNAVPVMAAVWKRVRLRAAAVPVELVARCAAVRHARAGGWLARHRAAVSRVERCVTNPALFAVLTVAAARSWACGNVAGCVVASSFIVAAFGLYLGPSRRARVNPIGDYPAWAREVEGLRASVRRDGSLLRS